MCSRFAQKTQVIDWLKGLGVEEKFVPEAREACFPGQNVAGVRVNAAGTAREAVSLHWGLIPAWAKDEDIGKHTFNARSETAAEKSSFRQALRQRRCLIPAESFFEWGPGDKGHKPLYAFKMKDGRPFVFAGLWELWKSPHGPVESCAILTCEANALVAAAHNRMPVILDDKHFTLWLDKSVEDPQAVLPLLKPYAGREMVMEKAGK